MGVGRVLREKGVREQGVQLVKQVEDGVPLWRGVQGLRIQPKEVSDAVLLPVLVKHAERNLNAGPPRSAH